MRHNVIELLVPVRSGQTQMAVEMLQALSSRWAAEHHAAAREHGLLHLSWYLAVLPGGAYILAHVEGIAPQRAIGNMLNADAPFTTWLRRQLSEVSGFRIDAASIQHLTHAPLVLVAGELPEPQLGGAAKRSSH